MKKNLQNARKLAHSWPNDRFETPRISHRLIGGKI